MSFSCDGCRRCFRRCNSRCRTSDWTQEGRAKGIFLGGVLSAGIVDTLEGLSRCTKTCGQERSPLSPPISLFLNSKVTPFAQQDIREMGVKRARARLWFSEIPSHVRNRCVLGICCCSFCVLFFFKARKLPPPTLYSPNLLVFKVPVSMVCEFEESV